MYLHAGAIFLQRVPVISIYLQDNKLLSRLRSTFISFIFDNIFFFSKLCIPEPIKPDFHMMQREISMQDLLNLKGSFYLTFFSL